jgi:hypothetical protein
MKIVMFGFEFVIGLRPTTETRISYINWLTKMHHIRCRMFHDSTWVPHIFEDILNAHGTYRWYVCRNCKTTWVATMTGYGDKQ